jgi:hypothetical protein
MAREQRILLLQQELFPSYAIFRTLNSIQPGFSRLCVLFYFFEPVVTKSSEVVAVYDAVGVKVSDGIEI